MNSIVSDQQYIDELSIMMKRQRALTALNIATAIKSINPAAKLDEIRKVVDVSQHALLEASRNAYGTTTAEVCKFKPLLSVDMLNPATSVPVSYFLASGKLADAFSNAVTRINGAMIQTPIYGYIDQNGHQILAVSGRGNAKGDAKLRLRGSVDIRKMSGYKEVSLEEIPFDRIRILIRN